MVPADPALPGDGYLVRRTETKGLELTDLSGGVSAAGKTLPTRVLVSKTGLGASIGRRTGWTVDRFGGHVAYVDDAERVHIVPTGVAAPPLAQIDAVAPAAALDLKAVPARAWTGKWWLSKPAASWTLTAKPADGQGAELTVSGAVSLSGAGARPARDHVGDGNGDLLGFKADGTAEFRPGGAGAFGAAVSGSGWTGANAVDAVLPFGDVDEDGCNDVLVRMAAGEVRAYRPGCGNPLKPASPYTVVGAGGWNAYDTLISPGDITGDGKSDLVARDESGALWRYNGRGNGRFEARVKIGDGWGAYASLS